MPAADPVDQRAARKYEQMLRYYVYSGRTPQSRLDWFEALPKRVRRSRRLIDEALGPIKAAETRAQEALAEQRARKLEESLRLAAARAQPRNLSCLKVDGKTWNSLGRRKRRCRAFASVGRAYNIRQRVADTAQSTGNPAFDTFLLHPLSCHVPKRPPTPLGLRETIWNVPGLVYVMSRAHDLYLFLWLTRCISHSLLFFPLVRLIGVLTKPPHGRLLIKAIFSTHHMDAY
ncbi:hypothetical protein RhiLY_09418 [Ceratobasidium sp. AG-Ba]|nr:hypothetical protein RhiLY_09418 [Ceratobasidium sp. AG-Ba]